MLRQEFAIIRSRWRLSTVGTGTPSNCVNINIELVDKILYYSLKFYIKRITWHFPCFRFTDNITDNDKSGINGVTSCWYIKEDPLITSKEGALMCILALSPLLFVILMMPFLRFPSISSKDLTTFFSFSRPFTFLFLF